jgi:multisubunit Na+/H+ antiporter MnhE subunit
MKIYYLLGFITTYVVSYLIFYYLYKKLNIEKLISCKISIRISLLLISTLLGGGIFYIIDDFGIIKIYQMLIKGLTFGAIVSFMVLIAPRNRQKS